MARPLDDPDRLGHMLEAAEKALRLTRRKKRREYDSDEVLQLALARLIGIIGEAASRVTQQTRASYSKLPWNDIIGMRNRIVHDYYEVNLDVLWDTVRHELPQLIESLKQLLPSDPKSRRSRKKPPQ